MPNKYYRKGYKIEIKAIKYMRKVHGAVCIRSAGSRSPVDLICTDGEDRYVVQVKGGKTLPFIDWEGLERYAELFDAIPLVLFKPDYHDFVEIWDKSQLSKVRKKFQK